MTALLSLDEQLYKKVSSEHKSYCYSLFSLLAFKLEISMSLTRDICFLAPSIPSSEENKGQKMIMIRLSSWVYNLSCTCNLFSVPLIFAAVTIFASELHKALSHVAL